MQSYEAMFILKPRLKEEEQKALVEKLENILREGQAKIVNSRVFGQRALAYEIKKCNEGLYYLIDFLAPQGKVIANLKHTCNINEDVLRALIVRKATSAAPNKGQMSPKYS